MDASRFTSLSEENITQLLNDKDSENTKELTKHHRLAAVLRKFYAEARKKDGQMSLCKTEAPFSRLRKF